MTKAQRAFQAVDLLKQRYKEAVCSLRYKEPYQLLLSTRLSAQCTDARVNIVTEKLFSVYPTIESLAEAPVEEVIEIVKPCGLGNTKGKDLVAICKMLLKEYNGKVPDTMEELLTLPGVGRKTANLILGDVYRKPAIVTDTHLIRISNRLGLVDTKDPKKVELMLKKIIAPEESSDFCHRVVLFGRDVCTARSPKCGECELAPICKQVGVPRDKKLGKRKTP